MGNDFLKDNPASYCFEIDENNRRNSIDCCELCGGEVDRNGESKLPASNERDGGDLQVVNLIRYLADMAYVSRVAPAIIMLKVAHPDMSDRDTAKILKINKSALSEAITKINTRTNGSIEKVLYGTRYAIAIKQRTRRTREKSCKEINTKIGCRGRSQRSRR